MEKFEGREAKYGKKMIEVKVRFWTDGIATEKGKIVPKLCWEGGVIRMERNDAHDIIPGNPTPFNTMTELVPRIEQVLKCYGVKVIRGTAKGLYTTGDRIQKRMVKAK